MLVVLVGCHGQPFQITYQNHIKRSQAIEIISKRTPIDTVQWSNKNLSSVSALFSVFLFFCSVVISLVCSLYSILLFSFSLLFIQLRSIGVAQLYCNDIYANYVERSKCFPCVLKTSIIFILKDCNWNWTMFEAWKLLWGMENWEILISFRNRKEFFKWSQMILFVSVWCGQSRGFGS